MRRGLHLDLETGRLKDVLSPEERLEFRKEFGLYMKLYNERWNVRTADYPHAIDDPFGFSTLRPELRLNWHDFIKHEFPEGQKPVLSDGTVVERLDFDTMNRALVSLLTGSGYAYRNGNETQAARLVRIFTPSFFLTLITDPDGVQIFKGKGYQELWNLEAAELRSKGVEIRLSTEVTRLRSARGRTVVRYRDLAKNEARRRSFEQVVFTAQPRHLVRLLPRTTRCVRRVLESTVTSDYRTYLVAALDQDGNPHPTGLNDERIVGNAVSFGVLPYVFGHTDRSGVRRDTFGQPVMVAKPHADRNVYMMYVHGRPRLTHPQIIRNIKKMFRDAGFDGRVHVETHADWKYFDRESGDIQTNYRELMSLQGNRGIWLTGEYFSFAATHEVYQISKEFTAKLLRGELKL